MLTKSTPEGARDYLVPSRVHPGQFFALPQSPQLFKQLLMVASFDRYYQITKCFRDEDLRADRQPEFTQVDIETSFMKARDRITALMEKMMRTCSKEAIDVDLPEFPRMSYAEAMHRFGSDKPDLRVTLELTEVTDAFKDVAFKVFAGVANRQKAAASPPCASRRRHLTRGEIDAYTQFVGIYGARAWPTSRSTTSPRSTRPACNRRSSRTCTRSLAAHGHRAHRRPVRRPDLLRRRQDQGRQRRLGALRIKIGHEKGLRHRRPGRRCGWSTSRCSNTTTRTSAGPPATTPTSPKDEHMDLLDQRSRASAWPRPTTWLNGWESAAARCVSTAPTCRSKVSALNIGPEEQQAKFGFLLDALKYGAPTAAWPSASTASSP